MSVKSRGIAYKVKVDGHGLSKELIIDFAVRRLKEDIDGSARVLMPLFDPPPVLVPAPPSAPLTKGALWVPRRICAALVAHGLGSRVEPLLERTHVVPKSAFARPGERPTPEVHLDSIRVRRSPGFLGERVLLVDDVVTKGATLLGAASALAVALPRARVTAFALIRTMGLVPDVDRIVAPCIGTIMFDASSGEARRDP